MGKTYANQLNIICKKTDCRKDFLQISNEEWKTAAKNFGGKFGAFKVYLYLASNAIGSEWGLSKVALEKELGISKSTYYNVIETLVDLGYLVQAGDGTTFEFYTTPKVNTINSNALEISEQNSSGVEIEENTINSSGVEIKTGVPLFDF